MVHLDSITTKTGDAGRTRLGDGTEVSKTDLRIEALGSIDELNCVLGLCNAQSVCEPYFSWLRQVQNDLFDLGADVSIASKKDSIKKRTPRFKAERVQQLDGWLEELHQQLPALTSFILPGGTICTATLHLARSVCRRAERDLLRLAEKEEVDRQMTIYLNRLSDLLFQIARIKEDPETPVPLWKPG